MKKEEIVKILNIFRQIRKSGEFVEKSLDIIV